MTNNLQKAPAALALEGMTRHQIQVNDHRFTVFDAGEGIPVFCLHGFPGSSASWRYQVTALLHAGFRAIAPDLLGEGDSDMPEDPSLYTFAKDLENMLGILDVLKLDKVHVVAHDRGAIIGWLMASLASERVESLIAMSVGHPMAYAISSLEQREKTWFALLYQFRSAADLIQHNDWEWFRTFMRHHPETDLWIKDLSRPNSLNASLNWYRANFNPDNATKVIIPKTAKHIPVFGMWST
jgi:pimeloyl-ACP methyl ester carboxylesterase